MARFNKGDIVTIMNVPANKISSYSRWIGKSLQVIEERGDITDYILPNGYEGSCFTSRLEFYNINLENE